LGETSGREEKEARAAAATTIKLQQFLFQLKLLLDKSNTQQRSFHHWHSFVYNSESMSRKTPSQNPVHRQTPTVAVIDSLPMKTD
jgi:hypothetical protein